MSWNISQTLPSLQDIKSNNVQASESSGTGRKSRATVKIPVLGHNPKFAHDTYSLEINEVRNRL